MNPPLVSCIVPVFNGERYLAETLDSILAQSYRPLEIIVADDGSTDGTADIVTRYGEQVRCVRQHHTGAPAARNLGLQAAQGAFVAFLDADDLWHREKLERQMARFAACPELDLSVTQLQNFWIPELRAEAERLRDHPIAQPQPGYVTVTMLARRALFERVGGFNPALSVGDPMEWFVRAAEHGAVMDLLPETLVYRRMHHNNLSWESGAGTRMTGAMQNAILRVVKESLDRRRQAGGPLRAYDFPDANPLVSCIVPVYNGSRYIREALDSILAQTHRPIEVIVADDGSTDGTAAVVASYGDAVRSVSQATAGPSATRNLGLRAARGGFVAFLDADDLWHPEKLSRQLARFATRPDLDVSVTHIQNFWIAELEEEAQRLGDDPRAGPLPGYVTMTLLARRALFESVGPFDEALWHTDAGDWFVRAAKRGAVMEMLPDVLVHHRMHHDNLSRRHGSASRQEFVRMVKRSLDERRKDGEAARPFAAFPDTANGD